MFENISENMTAEEIKKAEKELECARRMLKDLSKWQDDWERSGIDRSQIDPIAKMDISMIGEEAWLKARREKLEELKKQYEGAKEKIEKAKEKLKNKQA